jgi:two-component system, NtrC family, response regulator HydG
MSEITGTILVVDDNPDVLFAADLLLADQGGTVSTITDPNELPHLLKRQRFDLILLDMNYTRDVTSGQEGFDWLAQILEIDPTAVVILITAYADFEMAVRAIKAGATDFIVKPWQNEKLLATASSALALSHSKREAASLRSRQQQMSDDLDRPFLDFVGQSTAIEQVRTIVNKVAATDANVLITGANGTGKELVARALHRQSKRSREAFISVDMGALSENLFESELFGHVKGAFTDAREDRAGRFELADGGTLLLDEIGNLNLQLQAKLLTVLQSRQVTRVGSSSPRDVNIRLICATNLSLPDMVERGQFRQDLLYRVNTVEIPIPPLRERREDIPLLAHHFLNNYARKYRKELRGINAAALNKLSAYHWPGNVRELQHAIERAVIMSGTSALVPNDFFFPAKVRARNQLPLDTYNLIEIEGIVIRNAMAQFGGNISKVAGELGMSRPALYRRLERYGL